MLQAWKMLYLPSGDLWDASFEGWYKLNQTNNIFLLRLVHGCGWKLVKNDSRRYARCTGEDYTSSVTRLPLEGDYYCAADFRHRTWLLTSSGLPPPVHRSDSALPPVQRHQLSACFFAFRNLTGFCRVPDTCFFTFTNLTPFRDRLEPTMFAHFLFR